MCALFRNGMLREAQLSTRNMVNAVTDEFWKMVRGSISDQALHFKSNVLTSVQMLRIGTIALITYYIVYTCTCVTPAPHTPIMHIHTYTRGVYMFITCAHFA